MSNELNEVNIPNIKISITDLEVLEKKTLFFPESLFKKQQVNTIKSNNNINNFNNINNNFNNIKSFNNFNNINNNFNNNINYFNNKSKLYTIKSLNNRPFSYPMKFT
jgi:hypothetical protein